MSAPKPKDGDGGLPPPEDAHEIFLAGDEDPLIVLSPDAPPVPAPVAAPVAAPVPPQAPPPQHVTAVIDDTPAVRSPPPPPRAHAEYTTDPPSIATDRVRDPFVLPPTVTSRTTPPWARRAALVAA